MIKITFKNVGQGDSIILEWNHNNQNKIAIIDCNITSNKQNPVLDYLQSSEYREIEFVLLTHPHYDHYSGMNALLDFCEKKNIIIKKFLHTSQQNPEYLQAAVLSNLAIKELSSLFRKIKHLWKFKNLIEYQCYVSDSNSDLILTDDIKLKFLAPSVVEFDNYISNVPTFSDEEDANNKANANWLSTVIKIYSEDWWILLTSDCEKRVLKRLGIKSKEEFSGEILLGQCPHHGALGSHYNAFWKLRQQNNKTQVKTPIVFSVGNNIYNHPSEEVIRSFNKNSYKIFSTNKVGYLLSFKSEQLVNETIALLNTSSELVSENIQNSDMAGDKVFLINEGKIQLPS